MYTTVVIRVRICISIESATVMRLRDIIIRDTTRGARTAQKVQVIVAKARLIGGLVALRGAEEGNERCDGCRLSKTRNKSILM